MFYLFRNYSWNSLLIRIIKTYSIMKKNMGGIDRIIRITFAVIIAILYFTGKVEGTLATVLIVFAAIFLLTSVINFCPLYPVLGINTRKKDS